MWTKEEMNYAAGDYLKHGFHPDALRRIMTRAVELVQARGGTMTAEELRITPIETGTGPHQGARVREHIASQGATVATLQAKVDGLNIEMAERGAALDESLRRESDLLAKVERMKKDISGSETQRGQALLGMQSSESRLAAIREALEEMAGSESKADACLWCETVPPAPHKDRCRIDLLLQDTHPKAASVKALEGDAPQEAPDTATRGDYGGELREEHEEHEEPQEAKADNTNIERRPTIAELEEILNSPDNTYKVEVRPDGQVRAVKRYPCSPTCTHEDAATPDHPERVKERSEAVSDTLKEGLAVYDEAHADWKMQQSEEYQAGAEAMRAACLDAVTNYMRSGFGGMPPILKAAIEGAAP